MYEDGEMDLEMDCAVGTEESEKMVEEMVKDPQSPLGNLAGSFVPSGNCAEITWPFQAAASADFEIWCRVGKRMAMTLLSRK